jgi:iduronate 2-sulfatase
MQCRCVLTVTAMFRRCLVPLLVPFVLQATLSAVENEPAASRPNVLLILVDDLKPALGCYGDTAARTPHIDALAARGLRFDLAYCNQAVCAPSRFSLMLGSHSTSTGLYGLDSKLRDTLPEAVTLPQHFARHGGYRTESLGKIYHIRATRHRSPSLTSRTRSLSMWIPPRNPQANSPARRRCSRMSRLRPAA